MSQSTTDFEEGDIVIIDRYPIPKVAGGLAVVIGVAAQHVGEETAYLLVDTAGRERATRHAWLRRPGWDELRALLRWSGPDTANQT
jgi:hypothetical protein